MHIHQISVFLENRAGQLAEITRLLAQDHVDIRAISIAETTDYGLARLIVDDSYKASSILLRHGDILSRSFPRSRSMHTSGRHRQLSK